MYSLRTVDVWDTLLRRSCHPECIKRIVANHVFLRLGTTLIPTYADAEAVYKARVNVEKLLARQAVAAGGDDEYTIYDVITQWLQLISPDALHSTLVSQVVEYEWTVEAEHSFADPSIEEFLEEYPARQSIFLSDFYWPSSRLLQLLRDKGLDSVVTDGVSSCDVGRNKRSGKLFDHILTTYRVGPQHVVHIGDNIYSDGIVPRKRGIATVRFMPKQQTQERLRQNVFFFNPDTACDRISAEAEALARTNSTGRAGASAFLAGVEAAPLFISFTIFVIEQAIHNRLQHLYFLTREGVFLQRVFRCLSGSGMWDGLPIPEASLLYVSRASTQAAAFYNPTREVLSPKGWPHRDCTVGAVLWAMGVAEVAATNGLRRAQLSWDTVVSHPAEDSRVQQLLQDEEIVCVADKATAERRSALVAYLRQEGCVDKGSYGVIDIGWRGTIQDNIAAVLPEVTWHGYYVALRRQLTHMRPNVVKAGFALVEGQRWHMDGLLDTYGLMETLCYSQTGSVSAYEISGAVVTPVITEASNECPAYMDAVKPFQDGVVFACGTWQRYVKRHGLCSARLHGSAVRAWRQLSRTRCEAVVEAFCTARLHDPYRPMPELLPCKVPSVSQICRGLADTGARRAVIEYVRRVRWQHAIMTTRSGSRLARLMLVAVFCVSGVLRCLRSCVFVVCGIVLRTRRK